MTGNRLRVSSTAAHRGEISTWVKNSEIVLRARVDFQRDPPCVQSFLAPAVIASLSGRCRNQLVNC